MLARLRSMAMCPIVRNRVTVIGMINKLILKSMIGFVMLYHI